MDRTDKTGIYIHIPFCRSKCPYCDFYSVVKKECCDTYVDSLCDEIRTKKRMREFIKEYEIPFADTVYFGGGTPSLLSVEQLERILSAVKEGFILSDEAEITVECNPSSPFLNEFLLGAARLGVNRISLGMQSSKTNERRTLGRKGTSEEVEKAIDAARNAGIENISLDIMLGVPESTKDSVKDSLDFAINKKIPHISAYILKIEEGTHFYKNRDKLSLPSDDEVSDMYLFMSGYLKEKGYSHYEVSNFCQEGFFSRHNMKYWTMESYIGFGPAAHSFYKNKRFYFPCDKDGFIEGNKAIYEGDYDEEDDIIFPLRTAIGISLENKSRQFTEKCRFFEKKGLAEIKENRFILNSEGYLVSNSIITELLCC